MMFVLVLFCFLGANYDDEVLLGRVFDLLMVPLVISIHSLFYVKLSFSFFLEVYFGSCCVYVLRVAAASLPWFCLGLYSCT